MVTSDEPVLSAATGKTDAFTIPTQYKGDVPATMEARYGDDSNAGQTDTLVARPRQPGQVKRAPSQHSRATRPHIQRAEQHLPRRLSRIRCLRPNHLVTWVRFPWRCRQCR